jgi:hypothetical protein
MPRGRREAVVTERPSGGAHVIAQLVSVLNEHTCRQLCALLSDDVATRDSLTPAICSLAGVTTLIDTAGCVPTIDEYEKAREEQPRWPHHSSLVRRYGSWISAVSAAVKVTSDQRTWGQPARQQPQRRYSRADLVRAILRCKLAIGDWPDQREYALWQCVEADLCRRTGTLDRTPPSKTTVLRRLRTWPDALELARRAAAQPTADVGCPTPDPSRPSRHDTDDR